MKILNLTAVVVTFAALALPGLASRPKVMHRRLQDGETVAADMNSGRYEQDYQCGLPGAPCCLDYDSDRPLCLGGYGCDFHDESDTPMCVRECGDDNEPCCLGDICAAHGGGEASTSDSVNTDSDNYTRRFLSSGKGGSSGSGSRSSSGKGGSKGSSVSDGQCTECYCLPGNRYNIRSKKCEACGADTERCCEGDDGLVCDPGSVCLATDETCAACGGDPDAKQACCEDSTCKSGFICTAMGMCEPCGTNGKLCCDAEEGSGIDGSVCNPGLTCRTATNKCAVCGGVSNLCCDDNTCNAGLTCTAMGRCEACGDEDDVCCADDKCKAGFTCSACGKCVPCGELDIDCCDVDEGDTGDGCGDGLVCGAQGKCNPGGCEPPTVPELPCCNGECGTGLECDRDETNVCCRVDDANTEGESCCNGKCAPSSGLTCENDNTCVGCSAGVDEMCCPIDGGVCPDPLKCNTPSEFKCCDPSQAKDVEDPCCARECDDTNVDGLECDTESDKCCAVSATTEDNPCCNDKCSGDLGCDGTNCKTCDDLPDDTPCGEGGTCQSGSCEPPCGVNPFDSCCPDGTCTGTDLDCVDGTCSPKVTRDECVEEGKAFEGFGCTTPSQACCLNKGEGEGSGYSCKGCGACTVDGNAIFTNKCCDNRCNLAEEECCAEDKGANNGKPVFSCFAIGTCEA